MVGRSDESSPTDYESPCPNCGGFNWKITRIRSGESSGECTDCKWEAAYSVMKAKQETEDRHEIDDLVPTPNRKQRRAMKSKKHGRRSLPPFQKNAAKKK